jgi:hypothetical protein
MSVKLTIPAGADHTETVRYESAVIGFVAVAGITKAAPPSVSAVGHGLKTGWPVAVVDVKGMHQINAKSNPPAGSDKHAITSTGVNSLTLDGISSIGYSDYVSGGTLRYNLPVDLTGATARMHLVDKWTPLSRGVSYPRINEAAYVVGDIMHVAVGAHYICTVAGTSDVSEPTDLTTDGTVTWAAHPAFSGTTAYAVLTTENGAIVIDETESTITWTLDDAVSSAATWTSAIAQLEVDISGVVHRVKEYSITLSRETTR